MSDTGGETEAGEAHLTSMLPRASLKPGPRTPLPSLWDPLVLRKETLRLLSPRYTVGAAG